MSQNKKNERTSRQKQQNLGSISPFQMLRIFSRIPTQGPSFDDIPIEKTIPKTNEPLKFVPIQRDYEAEFYKKYNSIPLLDFSEVKARDVGPKKFWERKRRHDEMIDTESFIARTDTNYSRLDYKPKSKYDDDNDDAKTWRTQDMLSEYEEDDVVLDSQKIVELRQTIDEQFIKESRFRSSQLPTDNLHSIDEQIPIDSQHSSGSQLPIDGQPSTDTEQPIDHLLSTVIDQEPTINEIPAATQQSQVEEQNDVQSLDANQSQPSISIKDEKKQPETKETQDTFDVPLDFLRPSSYDAMEFRDMEEEINNLPNTNEDKTKEMMPDDDNVDWGDDFGQADWSENEIGLEIEGDTSTKELLIENFTLDDIQKYESEGKVTKGLSNMYGKKVIQNVLGFNTKLILPAKTINTIGDIFFDQLIKDLKAYKSDRSIDEDCVTDEDIISLMKRQHLLHDKTSIEQLAYKYLPRELSDRICASALNNNTIFPPISKKKHYDAL